MLISPSSWLSFQWGLLSGCLSSCCTTLKKTFGKLVSLLQLLWDDIYTWAKISGRNVKKRFARVPVYLYGWHIKCFVVRLWTQGWFMVSLSKYTTCPLVLKTRKCMSLQMEECLLSFWISIAWFEDRVIVNDVVVFPKSTSKVQLCFISVGYRTWAKLQTKQSRRSCYRHSRHQRCWNDESLERLADGKAIRPWRRFVLSEHPSGSEWNVCHESLYSLTPVKLIHFSMINHLMSLHSAQRTVFVLDLIWHEVRCSPSDLSVVTLEPLDNTTCLWTTIIFYCCTKVREPC